MARGKQTCKILKEIRRQIAEANGIEFVTTECRYKGDCLGTCPKCEAEVRYLEQQLRARSLAGKAVALAGISAGMILMSGCSGTAKKQLSETVKDERNVPIEQFEVTDSIDEGELPEKEDTVSIKNNQTIEKEDLLTIIRDINIAVPGGIDLEEIPATPDDKGIYGIVEQKEIAESREVKVKENEDSTVVLNTNKNNEVERDLNILSGEVDWECHSVCNEYGIYHVVDQSPEFPGGEIELMHFISDHLKYPEEHIGSGIKCVVMVRFHVDTLGRICDPVIERSKGEKFDAEALRVVSLLPNFTPAQYKGEKVKAWFLLPISFKLK